MCIKVANTFGVIPHPLDTIQRLGLILNLSIEYLLLVLQVNLTLQLGDLGLQSLDALVQVDNELTVVILVHICRVL